MRAFLAYIALLILGFGATADAGTSITFNGSSYTVPAVGDASWGSNVSSYLIAIPQGALQKTGGTFTLTSEVDTGATYGIKMPYLKTQTAAPATVGFVRAAKTDTIDWRNNANGANLPLGINASDRLQFNSIVVPGISTTDTLTNKTMDGGSNTFTNLPATGLTGIVGAANGGTGVANNSASTLTISGNFATTLTVSGATGLTLPTTGTLATRAGTETFTNKTLTSPIISSISNSGTLTLPTSSDTLVGRTTTDTLTNKTISGASNTLTVRLGSDVSGTLPIANGGTGQTSANAALNALLPSQGSNTNKALVTNGTDTSWVTVASASAATPTGLGLVTSYAPTIQSAVLTDSTNATVAVTTSDGFQVVRLTKSGVQTVTLPAVASNTGREITIINLTSGGSNLGSASNVTIDPNSSETIGPTATTTILKAYGSRIRLYCDGTRWDITDVYDEMYTERLRSSPLTLASTIADNVLTMTSIPSGVWRLTAYLGVKNINGRAATAYGATITTTSATVTGGDANGVTAIQWERVTADDNTAELPFRLPDVRVDQTATTTWYLAASPTQGSGSSHFYGSMRALRVN